VKKWFTHNEPIVPIEGGYLYDFHMFKRVNGVPADPAPLTLKGERHVKVKQIDKRLNV
jgi:hypothetical protein